MSYWLREVAGWALLVVGLVAFGLVYDLLLRGKVIEAGPLAFAAFTTFRGGIHLLKVAVAARAARDVSEAAAAPPRRRAIPAPAPRVTATDPRRSMPGPRPESTGTAK